MMACQSKYWGRLCFLAPFQGVHRAGGSTGD